MTTPARPTAKGDPSLRGRPWSLDPIREVLAGTTDPEILRAVDRKGMSSSQFALLQTAATADDLRRLLSLLEPPDEAEPSGLDRILTLLETIAEGQIRIETRLAALEHVTGLRAAVSPNAPGRARSASTA